MTIKIAISAKNKAQKSTHQQQVVISCYGGEMVPSAVMKSQ